MREQQTELREYVSHQSWVQPPPGYLQGQAWLCQESIAYQLLGELSSALNCLSTQFQVPSTGSIWCVLFIFCLLVIVFYLETQLFCFFLFVCLKFQLPMLQPDSASGFMESVYFVVVSALTLLTVSLCVVSSYRITFLTPVCSSLLPFF